MNKELIEKVSAIRQDLLALQALAQVGDAKKLAELVKQKVTVVEDRDNSPMWRNYQELWPYMTGVQKDNVASIFAFGYQADSCLKGGKMNPIGSVTMNVPRLLADLDDLAENLNKGNSGTAKIGSGSGS